MTCQTYQPADVNDGDSSPRDKGQHHYPLRVDDLNTVQEAVLEALFQQQSNPSITTKTSYASILDVSLFTLDVWYQNRRAKAEQEQTSGRSAAMTTEQHETLEAFFREKDRPSSNTKKYFAQNFGVEVQAINMWFQKRREEVKRHQDGRREIRCAQKADSTKGSTRVIFDSHASRTSTEAQPDSTSGLLDDLEKGYPHEDEDEDAIYNPLKDDKEVEGFMKYFMLAYGLINMILLAGILASDVQQSEQGWTIWASAGVYYTAILLCTQGLPRPFRGTVVVFVGQLLALVIATALLKIGNGEGKASCEVGQ